MAVDRQSRALLERHPATACRKTGVKVDPATWQCCLPTQTRAIDACKTSKSSATARAGCEHDTGGAKSVCVLFWSRGLHEAISSRIYGQDWGGCCIL